MLLKEKYDLNVFVYETFFEEKNRESLNELYQFLSGCNSDHLLVLDIACGLLKSVGLSILLLDDHIPVKKVLELSRLEDRFQYDISGKVEEFHLFDETELFMKLLCLKMFWKTKMRN